MPVKKKPNHSRKYSRIALVLLAVVVAVLAGLELTNTTYYFHKHKSSATIPSTASKTTNKSETSKTTTSSKSANAPTGGSTTAPTTPDSQKASTSGTTLTAPYGTFVSNHAPGKNDAPTTEQSVCNTTVGASCTIKFTKDGVTKSLKAQTVDSSGAAYWSWDINDAKDIGLTSGSWAVSAVATLNGQTQSTADVIPLEVQ